MWNWAVELLTPWQTDQMNVLWRHKVRQKRKKSQLETQDNSSSQIFKYSTKELPKSLSKFGLLDPVPRDFDSVGLQWSPGIYVLSSPSRWFNTAVSVPHFETHALEKAEWLDSMERLRSGSIRNNLAPWVSSLAAYWNHLGGFFKMLMPANTNGSASLGNCRFWKLPWWFWCMARLNAVMTEQKRLMPSTGIPEVTDHLLCPCLAATQAIYHKPWWLGRRQFGRKQAGQNASFKSFKRWTKLKARPQPQSRHNWL